MLPVASLFFFDRTGQEIEFPIAQGVAEVRIGRSSGNSLRIRAPSISRNHSILVRREGQFFLTDNGSSNGTYINGKRLAANQTYPVAVGDALRFGEVEVRFQAGSQEVAAPPPAAAPAPAAPPVMGAPPPSLGPPFGGPSPDQRRSGPAAPSAPPLGGARGSGGPVDLSHILDSSGPPAPSPAPPKDPLAGLFDDFDAQMKARAAHPAGPAASPAPALPKPGQGPVEISLDDLFAQDDASSVPGLQATPSEPPAPPEPAPVVSPAPAAPPAPTAPSPPPAPAAPSAPPALSPTPFPARFGPADPVPGALGAQPPSALQPAPPLSSPPVSSPPLSSPPVSSPPLSPPPAAFSPPPLSAAPPAAGPGVDPVESLLPQLGIGEDTSTSTSVPMLALADAGAASSELQAEVAGLKTELETRRRKVEALQKAARRDVEVKKKLQEDKTDLEVQVAALQEDLRQQAERFDADKAELRRELRANADQAHQEALERLEARVTELEELLADATSENQTRSDRLAAVSAERDDLELRLESLSSSDASAAERVATLTSELKQAVDERDSLMARVEELDVALFERPPAEAYGKLERSLAELKASTSERMAEYAAHIDVLVTEKSEFEARLAASDVVALQLEAASEDVELLQQRLQSLPDADEIAEQELELHELRRTGRELTLQIQELEAKRSTADGRFSVFKDRARATFEDLAAEIAALEEELEKARADHEETQEQAVALRDDYLALQEEEERSRADLERHQRGLEQLELRLEQLQEKLADASQREQQLQSELEERPLPAALEASEQTRQGLMETVQQLEEDGLQQELKTSEATKQVRRLGEELEAVRGRLSDSEAQLEEARAHLVRLEKLEAEHHRLREELEQAPSDDELSALRAKLDRAREATAGVEAERDVLQAKLQSREEDLAQARERLSDAEAGQGRDAERVRSELERLQSELEQADATIVAAEESRATLDRQLDELSRQLADQAAELATLQEEASAGAGGPELEALTAEVAALRATVDLLEGELEQARQALAAGGGAGPDLTPVRDLFQRINDSVSGWKNNFMLVGNYLLGLQNGLDVLRDAREPDQQQAAMAEIDRAGNIEEMQDLLRVCEDEARRMKREMLRLRDVLRD